MIFYGWWVVLATSLIHWWGAGTFFYSFTAFFNPLVEEFGWSYAAVSFAASIRNIEGGIASPLVGWAADRVGARRLLLAGSVLSGAGFVLLSRIQTLSGFYLLFIFLSIGSSLLFPIPGWAAVTNWFVRKRGTAISILSGRFYGDHDDRHHCEPCVDRVVFRSLRGLPSRLDCDGLRESGRDPGDGEAQSPSARENEGVSLKQGYPGLYKRNDLCEDGFQVLFDPYFH